MFLLEIVEALTKEGVSYAIAGGYAVALHGAVRGTVDVDLVIGLSEADYVGCEKALTHLGLRPKLPVSAREVFQFRTEYIQERNLRAWSFYDPKDPTHLVHIIITFGKRRIPVKTVRLEGIKVPILARAELIKMKRHAGRPQDIADANALESLK